LPYLDAADELRDNPGQWQAYESKGHCAVLAGPGSGKTKTLTIKMARMLSEDVQEPRGVACITYNSECAGELRRRLVRLGVREGRNIFIGTIHSFCLKHVILPYGVWPITCSKWLKREVQRQESQTRIVSLQHEEPKDYV
jgi:DNA helicase-2/ATP-dependent DNA helicase PcrA